MTDSVGGASRHRPAVRVLCIDLESRLLLLHWRDPSDGVLFWEPPGGGIEPGESPLDAARRELHEETGITGNCIVPGCIDVERDVWFNGEHFSGPEQFFVAHVTETAMSPQQLGPDEITNLMGHRWCTWAEVGALDDRIEPPQLRSVLRGLLPDGPW